ncbi:MAG TPA: hypothetical protein VIL06_02650, partial [Coriobacteriia bacterium]
MTDEVTGDVERGRAPSAPGPERAPEPRVGMRLLAVLAGVLVSVALQPVAWLAALFVVLVAVAVVARVDVRTLARRAVPVLPIIASMILIHGWANPANVHWI